MFFSKNTDDFVLEMVRYMIFGFALDVQRISGRLGHRTPTPLQENQKNLISEMGGADSEMGGAGPQIQFFRFIHG